MPYYLLTIVALGLLGGVLPLVVRRSDRLLHLFIAFTTGIFLGMVFLHLLPEVAEKAGGHGAEEGGDPALWMCVLGGVVGLFLVENLVFSRGGSGARHRHLTVGWASLMGLCVHAFTAGLGLAAAHVQPELSESVWFSIVSHKVAETFSLATVFMLAGFRVRRILVVVLFFSLVTPGGALVGSGLVGILSQRGLDVLTALAAGTFLFVALCDLLPEVFHHREDLWSRVGVLALGILASMLLTDHEGSATGQIAEFGRETVQIVCDTAPFLLGGFFLAGLLKVFLPPRLVLGHLGGNNLGSVVRSALYGVPLPLCSCSVIPTATALRRAGSSKGATASFLISTPETGVDSISVTYALLDPIMTVVRPVVAFATAVVTGFGVNVLARKEEAGGEAPTAEADGCEDECAPAPPEGADPHPPLPRRLREAVRYAYATLFDDLARLLVLGFLISGLIATLVPDDLFTATVTSSWLAMGLMLVVGTPLYICATASTPVAAMLVAKGLDPGAALVFLLVGPATNVTTLLLVSRLLGRRVLVVYLASIAVVAVGAGLATNALYGALGVDLSASVAAAREDVTGPVQIVGGVLFALLLVGSIWRAGRASALLQAPPAADEPKGEHRSPTTP